MKFRSMLPALLLLLAQLPAGCAMALAVAVARHMWMNTEMELPLGCILAIRYGLAIPVMAAAASVWLAVLAGRNGGSRFPVVFGVAVAEVILVALFALGLVLPGMDILHHMGNS